MRKAGLLIGLALFGFACAESVGQMLEDAGQMLEDAGTSMQDGSVPDAGAQDVNVTCNKSATTAFDGYTVTARWAEFEIDPGTTEVTVCNQGQGSAWWPPQRKVVCYRSKAPWIRGTSTSFVQCGYRTVYDNPDVGPSELADPISITVHR